MRVLNEHLPNCPSEHAEAIVTNVMLKDWTNVPVWIAVTITAHVHIRHCLTDYELLLKKHRLKREEARLCVKSEVDEIFASWRRSRERVKNQTVTSIPDEGWYRSWPSVNLTNRIKATNAISAARKTALSASPTTCRNRCRRIRGSMRRRKSREERAIGGIEGGRFRPDLAQYRGGLGAGGAPFREGQFENPPTCILSRHQQMFHPLPNGELAHNGSHEGRFGFFNHVEGYPAAIPTALP